MLTANTTERCNCTLTHTNTHLATPFTQIHSDTSSNRCFFVFLSTTPVWFPGSHQSESREKAMWQMQRDSEMDEVHTRWDWRTQKTRHRPGKESALLQVSARCSSTPRISRCSRPYFSPCSSTRLSRKTKVRFGELGYCCHGMTSDIHLSSIFLSRSFSPFLPPQTAPSLGWVTSGQPRPSLTRLKSWSLGSLRSVGETSVGRERRRRG